jgi:diaminopimelate epimerase
MQQITISEDDLRNGNFTNVQISETNEQEAYEHFVDSLPKFNDIATLA